MVLTGEPRERVGTARRPKDPMARRSQARGGSTELRKRVRSWGARSLVGPQGRPRTGASQTSACMHQLLARTSTCALTENRRETETPTSSTPSIQASSTKTAGIATKSEQTLKCVASLQIKKAQSCFEAAFHLEGCQTRGTAPGQAEALGSSTTMRMMLLSSPTSRGYCATANSKQSVDIIEKINSTQRRLLIHGPSTCRIIIRRLRTTLK